MFIIYRKKKKHSLILSNTEFSAIRASAKFCSQILERCRSFQCQYIGHVYMYMCVMYMYAMLMYRYVIFSLVSHKS